MRIYRISVWLSVDSTTKQLSYYIKCYQREAKNEEFSLSVGHLSTYGVTDYLLHWRNTKTGGDDLDKKQIRTSLLLE